MKKINKKSNNKKRNDKAITLIALVVTIIILLILAGVAVGFATNGSGLFDKAKLATGKYNNEVDKENYDLAKLSNEIDNLSSSRADTQSSGNPMGTIIAYYNSTAPEGYLACDGTEYNLSEHSEYRQLAKFLGAADDAITFKVPDLQGEFLRGAGTNNHTNQGNGATVGEHQDGTRLPRIETWMDSTSSARLHCYLPASTAGQTQYDTPTSVDYSLNQNNLLIWDIADSLRSNGSAAARVAYTTRPTNTSVLYCIKY